MSQHNDKLTLKANDSQYFGPPCKKCGSKLRYKSNHGCVFCSLRRTRARCSEYSADPKLTERRRALEAKRELEAIEKEYEL